MPSRSRTFAGSADLLAAQSPVTQPAPFFLAEGFYLGPQFYTRKTLRINPQGLVASRKWLNGNVGIAAEINHGKGVLAKSLAVGLSSMKAGIDEETGEFIRPSERVNDNKLEASKGEWNKITEYRMRKPIYLAGIGRIKVFDLRMKMTDIQNMELLILMLEDAKQAPLTPAQHYATQIIMHMILDVDGVTPELSWIGKRGKNIAPEDEARYIQHFNKSLREEYAAQLEQNENFRKQFEVVMSRDINSADLNQPQRYGEFARVREAGNDIFELINILLNGGPYGNTFGSENSLYDLLTDRYVHFDWVGMPARAAALLEAILKLWENAGARQENGAQAVSPHYVFHDEQGSEMTKSMAHATLRAEESRKVRATHTIHFDMFQNFDDLLKIGEAGSAFRAQGEVIHRAKAAWFIGKQPNEEAVLHAITNRGATDEEAYMTTLLPTGTWGLLVPGSNKPMEFFQHILLPTIAPLVDSTSASRNAAVR